MFDPPAMLFRHHRVVHAAVAAVSSPPPAKAVYRPLRRRYKNSRCLRSLVLYGDGSDLVDRGGGGGRERRRATHALLDTRSLWAGISSLLFFYLEIAPKPRQQHTRIRHLSASTCAKSWRAPNRVKNSLLLERS